VEFGHKAQIVEGDDGVIVDHNIEQGNPADAQQLAPAVERVITRTGRKPRTVTADRGYGEKSVEDDLADLGVRNGGTPQSVTSWARATTHTAMVTVRLMRSDLGSVERLRCGL
jgi:IS5 family transposase